MGVPRRASKTSYDTEGDNCTMGVGLRASRISCLVMNTPWGSWAYIGGRQGCFVMIRKMILLRA